MRIKRNLKLMSAYTITASAFFEIGVIVPYYHDVMGLSFQDFLIGEAVFAAVVVLLEVPMGWLSDQWQRKHVLALGAFFSLLGHACLLVGDNLVWAITAQGILGIAVALMSGTNVAMIYDSLAVAGQEGDFRKHEGRRGGFSFYTVAVAGVIGGVLYKLDPHLPLAVTLFFLLASIVFACMMDEPQRHKRRAEKHPIADMAATANYALRGHAEVGMLILFAAVLFCATKLIMWSQQPYYLAIGLDASLFGVLVACGFLLAGFSSQFGHRIDGRVGSLTALGCAWLLTLLICVITGVYQGLAGVALLMIGGSAIYGLANPRVSEAINKRVDSARRATILSTQSLLTNLFFIPSSLIIGMASDRLGIGGGLLAIAGWLLLAGLLLAGLLLRGDNRRRMMLL